MSIWNFGKCFVNHCIYSDSYPEVTYFRLIRQEMKASVFFTYGMDSMHCKQSYAT